MVYGLRAIRQGRVPSHSGAPKIVRGLKEGLTEDERYAVADHAVAQLKERGDPWRLTEEARADS